MGLFSSTFCGGDAPTNRISGIAIIVLQVYGRWWEREGGGFTLLEATPNTKSQAAGRASPQTGRPHRNPAAILKNKRGDVNYFSTVVFIFIAVLLLAFILDLFSIISTKQELDHWCCMSSRTFGL